MASSDGLNPEFLRRVQAMIAAAPGRVGIGSGFRSHAQQSALYAAKPNLAAKPGSSLHEKGLAVDFTFDGGQSGPVAQWVHANAARFGISFPMLNPAPGHKFEPWHGQIAGAAPMAMPATTTAPQATMTTPTDPSMPAEPDRHDLGTQLTSLMNVLENPIDFTEGKVA